MSRPRITTLGIMAFVAVIALGLALAERWSGNAGRRASAVSLARYYRWKQGWLVDTAAQFRAIPKPHDRGPCPTGNRLACPSCIAWDRSWLTPKITTPAAALEGLDLAIDVLERRAARHERDAASLWVGPPRASPAEQAEYLGLLDGPLTPGFEEAY